MITVVKNSAPPHIPLGAEELEKLKVRSTVPLHTIVNKGKVLV